MLLRFFLKIVKISLEKTTKSLGNLFFTIIIKKSILLINVLNFATFITSSSYNIFYIIDKYY